MLTISRFCTVSFAAVLLTPAVLCVLLLLASLANIGSVDMSGLASVFAVGASGLSITCGKLAARILG